MYVEGMTVELYCILYFKWFYHVPACKQNDGKAEQYAYSV